jgi:hypothetical protein
MSGLWPAFKQHIWPVFSPYIVGLGIFVIGGIILQILMMKTGGRTNRLSPAFNSMVGSLAYGAFFGLYLFVAYWIWGTQVIDDVWFAIIGIISFPSAGFFLRAIGFWYY